MGTNLYFMIIVGILRGDLVTRFVSDCFETENLQVGTNDALLVLIAKVA